MSVSFNHVVTSELGLEAAVARLGLGEMTEPAVEVDEAWSNDVFRVHTSNGVYAVKLFPPNMSRERRTVLCDAVAFEGSVLRHGQVLVPRPVSVGGAWLLDIATTAGIRTARCHEWVTGRPATRAPLSTDLIRDAGRSLGSLHALNLPGGDTSQLHRLDAGRWHRAVRAAAERGFAWAQPMATLTPLVQGLAADLEDLRAQRRPMRISHRDFDPKNAVVDPTGRLVITDWDYAGPVLAEAELIIAATSFANTEAGLREFVAAYREAGGDAGPADPLVMTVEAADLDWLLRNAEACTRADPADDLEQRYQTASDLIDSFEADLARLRAWPDRYRALFG